MVIWSDLVCLALALAPSCAALHFWCLYIMLSKSYLPRRCDWKDKVFYKSPHNFLSEQTGHFAKPLTIHCCGPCMDVLFVQLQIDVDEGPQGMCRACIARDRNEKFSQKSSPFTNKARCLRTPDLQAKERDKCTVEISTLSVRACLATEWSVLLSYLQKTKSRPEQAIAKGCKFIRTLKHLRVHCSRGQNVHTGEMMQILNVKKVSLLESPWPQKQAAPQSPKFVQEQFRISIWVLHHPSPG